jgi:hypothetical protein
VESIDEKVCVWPIITRDVERGVHAPWWTFSDNLAESWNGFRFNPTAEALAHILEHKELVSGAFIEKVTRQFRASLDEAGVLDSYYDIHCCVRLYHAPNLPEPLRNSLRELLRRSLGSLSADGEHTNYFELSPRPEAFIDSVIGVRFDEAVARKIPAQDEQGCWNPLWDWSGVDAAEWAKARREWQGVLTRITLTSLHHHGRIAGDGARPNLR